MIGNLMPVSGAITAAPYRSMPRDVIDHAVQYVPQTTRHAKADCRATESAATGYSRFAYSILTGLVEFP